MAKEKNNDPILNELIGIKRLLIFILIRDGVTQDEIAKALGVTQGTISKMFPGGLNKQGKK